MNRLWHKIAGKLILRIRLGRRKSLLETSSLPLDMETSWERLRDVESDSNHTKLYLMPSHLSTFPSSPQKVQVFEIQHWKQRNYALHATSKLRDSDLVRTISTLTPFPDSVE